MKLKQGHYDNQRPSTSINELPGAFSQRIVHQMRELFGCQPSECDRTPNLRFEGQKHWYDRRRAEAWE